jgi:hypothetical protein
MMTYALARPLVLSLETYSRLTGVHPDLIRQLVSLDLLQASLDLAMADSPSHRLETPGSAGPRTPFW